MKNAVNSLLVIVLGIGMTGCEKEECPIDPYRELEVVDRPIRGRLFDCQGKVLTISLPLHVYHLCDKKGCGNE